MTALSERQKTLVYVLTLLIMPLSGASIDLYSPSFPAMTHSFHATRAAIQLNASFYLLGYGLLQFIVGPIIDARGRRPYLLWGFVAYIVLGIFCALSHSIGWLLFLRLLQGCSVAFINTVGRVIVNDLYSGETFLKKTMMIPIFWALGPIVGPLIGGYIQHHYGWQMNFYFLSAYAFMLLAFSCFYFLETMPHKTSIHIKQSLTNYRTIVNNKEFIGSALLCGAAYSCLIVFSLIGPFMVQSELNYSAIVFGYTQLGIGICWLIGNLVCRKTIHTPVAKRTQLELLALTAFSVLMIVVGLLGYFSLQSLILTFIGLIFVGGTIFPAMLGNAMKQYIGSKITGSAAALFGVITMLCTALVSALSTVLKAESLLPMGAFFVCLCLVSLVLFWRFVRPSHIKKKE